MIPYTDNHFHSLFSIDGRSNLYTMVERQYQIGLRYITNTEHYDAEPDDKGFDYYNYEKIHSTIDELNRDYPMKIFHGIEVTFQEEYLERVESFLKDHSFDLIIGAVHYIDHILIKNWAKINDEFEKYFDLVIKCSQWKKMDVIGHIDMIKKYREDYNEKKYLNMIEIVLKNIIKNKKALGINTSGFRHLPKEQYPSETILRMYRDLGGELISIGSDSHHLSHIGIGYNEIYLLLKKLGFKKYFYFIDHQPIDCKIL